MGSGGSGSWQIRVLFGSIARCKGGCVYYAFPMSFDSYTGQNTWVCDLKDDRVRPLSEFPGYSNHHHLG